MELLFLLFVITLICLPFFLILIIIIAILSSSREKNDKLIKYNYYTYPSENKLSYNNIYEKKRYLTTIKEVEFYTILQEIATKYDLAVFSQVVLYELVNIKLNKYDKDYLKYWNKISSKSIDFVIINKKTTKILQCIELDDNTHNNKKRIERDIFINELFKSINLPLLRVPANNNYNKEYLENIIKNCIDLNNLRE